jgi:Thioesterase-like superfamily
VSDAFFVREGELFVPTGLGPSFWDPTKQGGAPICGLVAQLLDAVPAPVPMLPVRLTLDIYGAVPMAPLTARTRLLREGKRIQLAELELGTAGRTCARATLLRVRTEGKEEQLRPLIHPFPEGAHGMRRVVAESIRIAGSAEEPGPGAVWLRVVTPMIAGEPMNPLACVAAAADWGTTVSPPASLKEWTYANLDVSIHLSRMPRTDWMLLDGVSEVAGNGTGIVHMRMGDRAGMFGTAHQSVFLNRRQAN